MKVRFTFDIDIDEPSPGEDTIDWLNANGSEFADYISDTFGPYCETLTWTSEIVKEDE